MLRKRKSGREGERHAEAAIAGEAEAPSVGGGDAAGDGEAQAHAAALAAGARGAGLVEADEGLEDPRARLGGDAGAVVLDREDDGFGETPRAEEHRRRPVLGGRLG